MRTPARQTISVSSLLPFSLRSECFAFRTPYLLGGLCSYVGRVSVYQCFAALRLYYFLQLLSSPLLNKFFWVLGFLLWFVSGPEGLREALGRPRAGPRRPLWGLPGALGPPIAWSKNLETHTFCRALLSGRVVGCDLFVCRHIVLSDRGEPGTEGGASTQT